MKQVFIFYLNQEYANPGSRATGCPANNNSLIDIFKYYDCAVLNENIDLMNLS